MKELNKIYNLITEIQSTKQSLKFEILSEFSQELLGYPPGKDKPGKPPNLKKIQEILELLND